MSERNIEVFDSFYLHKKTTPVEFPLSEEMKQVVQDLKDTLTGCENATGVAAPQIGVSSSLLVYKIGDVIKTTVMINPKIVKARNMEEEGKLEMCLSYPGRIYYVPRYKNITVFFQDENGEAYVLKYSGFEARVLQHEIDHLDGLTIADRGKLLDEDMTRELLGEIKDGKTEEID